MMDNNIRRNIWHLLLEQESKTMSLEDEFRVESLPRCKPKYIKCGYVFICLKFISLYLSPSLRKREWWPGQEKGYNGEGRERGRHGRAHLQIAASHIRKARGDIKGK